MGHFISHVKADPSLPEKKKSEQITFIRNCIIHDVRTRAAENRKLPRKSECFERERKLLLPPQDHTGPRTIQQLKGNLRLSAHFFLPRFRTRFDQACPLASESITDDAREASERSEKEQKERGVRSHSRVQKVQ